jgi:hypothetical protein
MIISVRATYQSLALANFESVNPGFHPERMVVVTVDPAWNGYSVQYA